MDGFNFNEKDLKETRERISTAFDTADDFSLE